MKDAEKIDEETAVVARVLDDTFGGDATEIVINRGTSKGVKNGDKYLIFGYGAEIIDPVTNASLGLLEVIRGNGQVVHAQENFSTIRSINVEPARTKKTVQGGMGMMLGHIVEESIPQLRPFREVKMGDRARPLF